MPFRLRRFIRQKLLRMKISGANKVGDGVILSKDLKIGKGCIIGKNTHYGQGVRLGEKVKIGNDVMIEKAEIGDFSFIESRVLLTGDGKGRISIGKNCYIGVYNVLDNSNDITIGDFVHIAGPSTGLWTHSSAPMCMKGVPLDKKDETVRPTAPITIENNVYIGGNCTIYPGITIGHHSIVAPNSAVTRNVSPFSYVGGVPARVIRELKN